MRIKNVNPKGWYDIPGYDGIYQINYWADIEEMKTSAREKETEEKEPDDRMEEAANRLQHEASVKCSRELEKAQKYKEGYTQGVEDLLRCIRRGE